MDARQSKTVLDSGFNAVGSGFFVSGNWILDSNLYWNFRFLELYSGFQSPGFRIPQQKFAGICIPQARRWYPSAYHLDETDAGTLKRLPKRLLLRRFSSGKWQSTVISFGFIGLGYVHALPDSPLKKRERHWAVLTITKTSGTVTGDRESKLTNSRPARPK